MGVLRSKMGTIRSKMDRKFGQKRKAKWVENLSRKRNKAKWVENLSRKEKQNE